MDTAFEHIHTKIAELEARIADLRIAERELLALDEIPAGQKRAASEPKQSQKPEPRPANQPKLRGRPKASAPTAARQTIGAAIAEVLEQHGALSAAEIAEHIKATGRDINNRTVSFALQALKKRAVVKSADGKWALKERSRRGRPLSRGDAQEAGSGS